MPNKVGYRPTRHGQIRLQWTVCKQCSGISLRLNMFLQRNDVYVAYTSADRANMIGTAVHPAYRRRGIATYLKAYDINRCMADGQAYFETCSANSAMLRVNTRLGYMFSGLTEVRLVKYL